VIITLWIVFHSICHYLQAQAACPLHIIMSWNRMNRGLDGRDRGSIKWFWRSKAVPISVPAFEHSTVLILSPSIELTLAKSTSLNRESLAANIMSVGSFNRLDHVMYNQELKCVLPNLNNWQNVERNWMWIFLRFVICFTHPPLVQGQLHW
jgi:hypothetical protein